MRLGPEGPSHLELNGAFAWLLRRLGYAVTLLLGELTRADGGWGIPFDDMTLRVDLDRPYLVDVGFGDSARAPLSFDGAPVVESWGDRFRVAREGDWLFMERGGRESDFERRYRFSLEPRALADFRRGCEYHQKSPESPFTARALVTRALPGESRPRDASALQLGGWTSAPATRRERRSL